MRFLLTIGFMLIVLSIAALELDVYGQYENSFTPQMYDTKFKMTDMNKLRLDLSGSIDERIDFQANYNIQLYDGKTTFSYQDYLPDDILQDYANAIGIPADSLKDQRVYEYTNRYYLDNINLTLYWKDFSLRVGKQLLPWGSGYSRNPTDCFHQKNILDPTYDKEGVNAFKLDYNLTLSTTLTAIMKLDEEWEKSTRAVKLRSRLLDYDFSLSFVRSEDLYESEIDQYGADLSGQLLGLGVWAEGAWRDVEDDDNDLQLLGGTDYTFENGLYLMAEYYYNEIGRTDSDEYTINDWMGVLIGEKESLAKHYAYTAIQYPLTEIVNGSLYASYNVCDGSVIFYPWIDFTLGDNIVTDIVVYVPVGKENTEYGTPDVGGMLRLKVFF